MSHVDEMNLLTDVPGHPIHLWWFLEYWWSPTGENSSWDKLSQAQWHSGTQCQDGVMCSSIEVSPLIYIYECLQMVQMVPFDVQTARNSVLRLKNAASRWFFASVYTPSNTATVNYDFHRSLFSNLENNYLSNISVFFFFLYHIFTLFSF